MLKAPKQESSYEPPSAGSHVARCYSIVIIGTIQPNNPSYNASCKIRIGWELPNETRQDSEGNEVPQTVAREYGFTMGKRGKLRPMIEGWFGKSFANDDDAYDFDLEKLIGRTCMIALVHETSDDKTYANISSVSGVPKGLDVPGEFNAPFYLTYEKWDQAAFESLPEYLRTKMMTTPEYRDLELKAQQANEVSTEQVEKAVDDSTPIKQAVEQEEDAEEPPPF